MIRYLCLVMSVMLSAQVLAEPSNSGDRAKFNYQLFCQGCHVGTGIGGNSVPRLKGFVGNFLLTQEGREYLVKVPGSANSKLSDRQLAEVLNWILVSFANESLPEKWLPYQALEVGDYRQNPLFEVVEYRKNLVNRLPLNS